MGSIFGEYGPVPPRHNVRWPDVCRHNPTMMQRMHAYGDCGFECAQVQLMGNPGDLRFNPARHVDGNMVVQYDRVRMAHEQMMRVREHHYRL